MEYLHSWLALKAIPGVGNHLYKRLIDAFGTPEKVFRTDKSHLLKVSGVSDRIAGAITTCRVSDSIKKELALAEKLGCRIITFKEPEYPPLLRHIPDPPPYLYVNGRLEETDKSIAVVGSRQASSYGITMARRLSRDLSARGVPIVSGMARGVDAAAHQGAISAGGKTYAVLGSGMGVIYPPENRNLFNEISENGAVISEFPVLEEPNAYNFPARNRIISGMSLGTIVVEAAQKSGSLITARLAAEQNREVFAVPGNINSGKSIGAHNLLKQGAKLVACADDVLEEFYQFSSPGVGQSPSDKENQPDASTRSRKKVLPDLTTEESLVYKALDAYPVHIDDLSRQTGLQVGKLSIILLNLELKGLVSQNPGKYFNIT